MKKYYHKLFLVLMDMGMVNAWIHFSLVHYENETKRGDARADFVENCANGLIETNWEMLLWVNGGVITQNSSNNNLMTMMGVMGQTKDNQHNWHNNGTSGVFGVNKEALKCLPVSFAAGQYKVPSKKGGFAMPSRDGSSCMVCHFEERGRGMKVSGCLFHGV